MGKLLTSTVLLSLIAGISAPAAAQAKESSGTILLQSVQSDDPLYRRMVVISYPNGVSYKAYTRREFKRADDANTRELMAQCAGGAATSLRELKAFEKAERRREKSGQAPVPATFCIKNVPNWAAKNKDLYLDRIFNGMPYVSKRMR